jgi:hypothetical protein
MEHLLKAVSAVMCVVCMQTFAADKPSEWKPLDVPREILTKQEIVRTPEGWSSGNGAHPNALAAVSISEGPPENQASLVYDSETRHKNRLMAVWRFESDAKEQLWISCTYSGTCIAVKKPLPGGIKELRVTYDDEVRTDGMPTVEKVEYR